METNKPTREAPVSHYFTQYRQPRVAVLCCSRFSEYTRIEGTERFDIERDARSFPGQMPVVAHPPCAQWSNTCAHLAVADEPTKSLGPLCVAHVKRWGGVLEHPAHSRLWSFCELPQPGQGDSHFFCLEVCQSWWDAPLEKPTWLLFSGIHRRQISFPITLRHPGCELPIWNRLSRKARSHTPPNFAQWLVDVARRCWQRQDVPSRWT